MMKCFRSYTEKTIFTFPFILNGIWPWWQISFDFEPNVILFGLKSKGKRSPRSYPIQFERKWIYSYLSVVKLYLITLEEINPHLTRFNSLWIRGNKKTCPNMLRVPRLTRFNALWISCNTKKSFKKLKTEDKPTSSIVLVLVKELGGGCLGGGGTRWRKVRETPWGRGDGNMSSFF